MRPHKLAYVARLKAQHTLSDFSCFINTRRLCYQSHISIMRRSSNVEELELDEGHLNSGSRKVQYVSLRLQANPITQPFSQT